MKLGRNVHHASGQVAIAVKVFKVRGQRSEVKVITMPNALSWLMGNRQRAAGRLL